MIDREITTKKRRSECLLLCCDEILLVVNQVVNVILGTTAPNMTAMKALGMMNISGRRRNAKLAKRRKRNVTRNMTTTILMTTSINAALANTNATLAATDKNSAMVEAAAATDKNVVMAERARATVAKKNPMVAGVPMEKSVRATEVEVQVAMEASRNMAAEGSKRALEEDLADVNKRALGEDLADVSRRALGEDMVDVKRRVLAEDMVDVRKRILAEGMADVSKRVTGKEVVAWKTRCPVALVVVTSMERGGKEGTAVEVMEVVVDMERVNMGEGTTSDL